MVVIGVTSMFEGLTAEVVIVGAIVALFWTVISTVVVWKWIVPHFFGPYVKSTIVEMLARPDPETKRAIATLSKEILFCPIETGKKLKDEEGNESLEVMPLYRYMAREFSNFMLMKFKGMRGGSTTQAGADLVESDPALMALVQGGLGPRKGQTTVEWLLERAAPQITDMVMAKLKKGGGDIGGGGQW
jgi:hypothetical protein